VVHGGGGGDWREGAVLVDGERALRGASGDEGLGFGRIFFLEKKNNTNAPSLSKLALVSAVLHSKTHVASCTAGRLPGWLNRNSVTKRHRGKKGVGPWNDIRRRRV
jgi:hypothetical protein